ncbi:MAG: hypothetical protein JSU61_00930 [Fidelibacterota bacterium]|nr:MAG: hypothetical protein JSU61_00930 [Candidatus Neomarinimicrobiota bacterium]
MKQKQNQAYSKQLSTFWRISLLLLTSLSLIPLSAQQVLWDQLMEEGNQAFAEGAPFKAERLYRQALQVAAEFPPLDLRRVTNQRNLARALIAQGNLVPADSLYGVAFPLATRSREPNHPFIQSLRNEWDLLRADMARPLEPEREMDHRFSLSEFIRRQVENMARQSTIRLIAALPMGSELGETNGQGFGYGVNLRIPLLTGKFLGLDAGLKYSTLNLPARHALDKPFPLEATSLSICPILGPLQLAAGVGGYALRDSKSQGRRLGYTGGVGLAIRSKRQRSRNVGLQTMLLIQGIFIPDAAPLSTEPLTILQAGLSLGWRW